MIIRNGNYTLYNGVELQLFEERYESQIHENEKQYSICYNAIPDLNLEGFEKHPFANMFCKRVRLKEINNAFFIQTYGLYKGISVKVFEYKPDPAFVYVTTEESFAFYKYSFLNQGSFYAKDIEIKQLEKLWEVRKDSQYKFPLPSGLELYKEIEL